MKRKKNILSDVFDNKKWHLINKFSFTDITYHRNVKHVNNKVIKMPTVRIAFNRPKVRNAFRPKTIDELYIAFDDARSNPKISTILLTGNGPSEKDGVRAFCSGGDQKSRHTDGYRYQKYINEKYVKNNHLGRMHILEVQRLIHTMPKIVIAVINGWVTGGGHSLHVVCDLSIASKEYAKFKQTDAKVGSFDAGYGSALLARQVGQKIAKEIFFLGKEYSATEMKNFGAINDVVKHDELETKALQYCQLINQQSPQSIRMLKLAFNIQDDGLSGQQIFAGEVTRLAYMTKEAEEGKNAFLEKRNPNWSNFHYYY